MTTNNHTNQIHFSSRHIMAFTFGMVIPWVLATLGLPFIGIWIAGLVFCIYAFSRQNSEAALFGMFISIVAAILIIGGVEAKDALDKPVEIFPSYVMQ